KMWYSQHAMHMDALAHQALNYETLLHALGGSEAKAIEAFNHPGIQHCCHEPLSLHIDAYASHLHLDAELLSKAYWFCRPFFEEMDDKTVILGWDSPAWPKMVDSFAYRPRFLYAQGKVQLLSEPSVSVIGTRSPSLEGKKLALQTSQALSQAGFIVTSGLALGIDGVAHKAALATGSPTIAVIGTPLSTAYPPEHADLQAEIARTGVVVTRFAPSTTTQKWHFLLRNRLMSALSVASIVVEDRDGGGAVRQASFALEQKKYLFLYQSSVDNHAFLWPRQFANQSRVFTIKKPEDLPRVLTQAMKDRLSLGKKVQKPVQLDLFSAPSP
ncbi:MAG: DNA-processing protein DprA, partial [Sphaerochaeta sp.]|nr:DNA-processing protein DprA [Sphaerochaeta sp.]